MAEHEIRNLFDVRGRVVVITGGSRGIGAFLAEAFAVNGAKVFISSRSRDACEKTAAAINVACSRLDTGGKVISLPADLSTTEGVAELCAGIEAQTDHVHTLINNAGATWGAPLEEYPSEAFDKLMALNVRSVFQTTQRLLPLLRKGTNPTWPASIINIGSINGLGVSVLETYAYAASKAAVHHLTRVLAARLAADHVTVNAIAPGPFPTKMTKHVLETFREQIVERVPLGRVGRPSDLTGLCIALASRAGSYTSGAVIPVDGGALIQASL